MDQVGPLPIFVNKVLLEYNHSHLFIYLPLAVFLPQKAELTLILTSYLLNTAFILSTMVNTENTTDKISPKLRIRFSCIW